MNKLPVAVPRSGRPTVLCVQPVAEQGGSDQALLRMAGQLSTAGWDVHIALPAPSPMAASYESAGATLHVVPMRRISTSHSLGHWAAYAAGWPAGVAHLTGLARRCRADLVHSNSLHSWYGWAAARLAGLPHIWHAREIVTQSGAALRLERYLCRHHADLVLAASGAVADQLPGAATRLAYELAAPQDFVPGRAGRARALYGLDDAVPTVGYVGRVDTWKGVDVLLEAFELVKERHPGAAAVVAGGKVRGTEAYYRGLEARAGVTGALWLGPLPGAEAADLMADLDVLAYPSTGPEPWGLTLVEALACGVPVVATDAGGPREMLAGLGPGVARLVPPGDVAGLADALGALLPAATSTGARRARPALRLGPPPPYPAIFAEVARLPA